MHCPTCGTPLSPPFAVVLHGVQTWDAPDQLHLAKRLLWDLAKKTDQGTQDAFADHLNAIDNALWALEED
jgi:hypothetical protein